MKTSKPSKPNYNGWTGMDETQGGRFTWLVFLHISNSERLNSVFERMTDHAAERGQNAGETRVETLYRLANEMRDAVENMLSPRQNCGPLDLLRQDLLTTAISVANFYDIAEAFLGDCEWKRGE